STPYPGYRLQMAVTRSPAKRSASREDSLKRRGLSRVAASTPYPGYRLQMAVTRSPAERSASREDSLKRRGFSRVAA
ncbi:hypothetical protein, partial [Raoultella sp. T31]|uniref:hypothetical protein n=1 Tax=Raoultella sp. T31 TaxID=2054594 RepID=UPI00197DABDF